MIKKQKFNIIIILALLIGLLGWGISLTSMKAHAAAPKYYVRSSYSGDCTSWDTACDLQMALSKAGEGDIIWVAAGTYKPTTGDNREATFQLKSGVEIYGGFPENGGGWEQRNWKAHHTILSGDIGAEHNSYHVVTGSDVDESAVLDGFTITGGNADFENLHDYGGGMYNIAGSPSLRNLIFIKNTAVKGGGGMYNASGSEPILEEITFTANTAEYGGGMYNRHCSPSLTEVNFTDNTAEDGGGGIYNNGGSPSLTKSYFTGNTAEDGGGMYNDGSTPSLTEINFSANTAEYGGGMYNNHSNPSLTEVNFSANTAEYGGGMYNDGSSPNLMKVGFTNNYANWSGGGMFNESGTPHLKQVTFRKNSTDKDGGGMCNKNSSPILTEVIFSENSAHQGGGISNDKGHLTLTKVIFSDNLTSGELFVYGGGMYSAGVGSTATLTEVSFNNNSTSGTNAKGGGMYYKDGSITLTNVTFSGNSVIGENVAGGGMCHESESGSMTLTNVTFSGNLANGQLVIEGGGLYVGSENAALTNVTVSGNLAGAKSGNGGGVYVGSDSVTLINTILWGNKPDQISGKGKADISYSIVEGKEVYPGDGNLNENPLLLPLADNGGYTLTHALERGSPAIDAGSPDICPQTDQRGVNRPIDGNGDGVPICDMGAYEFDPDERILTVTINPPGMGNVSIEPDLQPYHDGDELLLTAIAKPDWVFSHWSGDVDDGNKYDNPLKLTIEGNTEVTAHFTQEKYNLTLIIDPRDEAGEVQRNNSGPYHYNDEVTLTAVAKPGWSFSHWNDDSGSTNEVLEITITGDTTVTAHFKEAEDEGFKIFLPLILG